VSSDTETFLRIEIAIVNHTIVEFVYNDKPRTVKPYKLVNTKGIWYLAGVEDDKLKTFSFKKISKVIDTDLEFKIENEILENIQNSDNTWFSHEPVEVVIRVDAEVSRYFTRRKILPNQTIVKELAEGGLLVSAKVAFDEEILKLVRYWIPHVKIISPVHLQEKLEDILKKYLNL
jgi:predicted DNA-binding transcriptional regulator YafY